MKKISLLIPTKNRLEQLKLTILNIQDLLNYEQIHCILCDDGSIDGTSEYILENYPAIEVIKNNYSRGIHYSRNMLLNSVKTPYAISLDDDANFLTKDILSIIEKYFESDNKVGLFSFRVFWSLKEPLSIYSDQKNERTKSFGAVGFAIRMSAWKNIPNFPEWFIFYGEEDFASFQLFKKGWEVHYVPEILVHHRVDIKSRKKDKDYRLRLRRSLRSGWYLYFLFYPWKLIPKKFIYTLWMQLKLKVFKGDFKALIAIIQALFDVLFNFPKLIKNSNRLSMEEFNEYAKLPDAKLYWNPEEN